ncbi:MAG TPA: SRPBCC domain-containing protein [Ktedonobacteraceae bacterium]|nr:SRPBCC domain-containing protein [Ktedonobacteraceae bacterium]
MSNNTAGHVYEIIVRSTPENVWKAITDGKMTEQYYFNTRVESDWKAGSAFRYYDQKGGLSSEGAIVEITPQSHLKTTWKPVWLSDGQPSTLIWDIQPLGSSTLLKLTQTDIDDATFEGAQMGMGWVFVLSSLKSLLETNKALDVPEIFG